MNLGTVTTLPQMIPVIVLSGAALKTAVPRESAVRSFDEVSKKEANEMIGRDSVEVAEKNPNTIFHTLRGEIIYADGRYFVR